MINTKPSVPANLRAAAEDRLRAGTAPASAGWEVGVETLSLLYRLASDPESSADALKLLHELQTHQVELDLQHAQLAENESQLAFQLAHFEALFHDAPAAYLVLSVDGHVVQSNHAAGALFGLETDQLQRHSLTRLLHADSTQAVMAVLRTIRKGGATQPVRVQTLDCRCLILLSVLAPGQDGVLVLMFPEQPALES